MITFTGSPDVGWGIKARAPRKKVGLELGNNAPLIIEPSADLEAVATKVAVAGFSHAGQSCISTQRLLVHRDVKDALLDALVPLVEGLVVGAPMDEQTDVSALISTKERDRVTSWVDEAVASGAEVLAGGKVREDGVLMPTVLGNVTPDMKVCALEVFGPVVARRRLRRSRRGAPARERHALRPPGRHLHRRSRATRCAPLAPSTSAASLVNEVPTFRADQQPYGGVRDSGNTREGPQYAVREMTEERVIIIQV